MGSLLNYGESSLGRLDSAAVASGLGFSVAWRILVSRPGFEPESPALQSRLLTTGLQGSPGTFILDLCSRGGLEPEGRDDVL